jgi:hypothetical protein
MTHRLISCKRLLGHLSEWIPSYVIVREHFTLKNTLVSWRT